MNRSPDWVFRAARTALSITFITSGSEIGIGERKRGWRGGVHHFHTDLIPERCLKGSVQDDVQHLVCRSGQPA